MSTSSDDPIQLMKDSGDYLEMMNVTIRVVATKSRRFLPPNIFPKKRREWTGCFREEFELWEVSRPVLAYYDEEDDRPEWTAQVFHGYRFRSGEPFHANWNLVDIEVDVDV